MLIWILIGCSIATLVFLVLVWLGIQPALRVWNDLYEEDPPLTRLTHLDEKRK